MTLEETTAYLNRTSKLGWEYEGPVLRGWRFNVTNDAGSLTRVTMPANPRATSKKFHDLVKEIETYFRLLKTDGVPGER